MNVSLQRAIETAGSQQRLAERLGIRSASISEWKTRGRVPAERVLAIEAETGVSRHQLRPDVFGPEARSESPAAGEARALIDSRINKRALRARLGLSTDKQLAKVLQLPAEQVTSWPEDGELPALPQITNLLGLQERVLGVAAPQDPDESRIVTVEVA